MSIYKYEKWEGRRGTVASDPRKLQDWHPTKTKNLHKIELWNTRNKKEKEGKRFVHAYWGGISTGKQKNS